MARAKEDSERENRIVDEIVVDAFGAEEQAMGWFHYLEETIVFPFHAKCISERAISPLKIGDEIEPYAMAPEDECANEMFVMIPQEKGGLAVPLSQIEVTHGDNETREALLDWHYWVKRGYSFG
jgi:hypothetical protein